VFTEPDASSPIRASVNRAEASRKRKRADIGETTGPSGGRVPKDVLAAHKQKQHRKDPNPVKLAAIARGLSTPHRNNNNDNDVDDEAPAAKGKKQRKRASAAAVARVDRPKYQLGAYTPNMRKVLGDGKRHYKLKVVTQNAYPDEPQRIALGQAAFQLAKERESAHFNASSNQELDQWKLRVIADTSWGFRGRIKALATAQVVSGYALEMPRILGVVRTKATIRDATNWTKDRVATLLTNGAYLAGPHNEDPNARYMNTNISTLIRASIGSFGPDMQAIFTPMPHATVALATSSLEMALRQWTTGRFVPVQIGPEDEKAYKRHLKRFVTLRDGDKDRRGKVVRYNNLMHAIALDTFFYDNHPAEEDEIEESDDLELLGEDSSDDEPAYE
jgi:Domain of unknown function (DUF6532)